MQARNPDRSVERESRDLCTARSQALHKWAQEPESAPPPLALVQPLTRTAQPNVWHLPSAFNRPTTANSEALPEIRAMRGMARIAAFTSPADSIGFGSPRGAYTKPSDKFESPNSRISAPFRRVLPRSKLDAKMWAQSPG